MKKFIFSIFTLFMLGSAVVAQDMTVDQILEASMESLGGLEAQDAIKNMQMTGSMFGQGMEFAGNIYAARPNKMYLEIDIQGKKLVQATDGETAWTINPFMGGDEPQPMSPEEASEFNDQPFESDFIRYKEKGHKVSLEGSEMVEGTDTYKIKLERANGDIEYHFFDKEYHVPIMQRSEIKSGPAKGQFTETFMSDYQEVEGMMVPFFSETKMGGQSIQKLTIKEINCNVDIDDSQFSMPGAAKTGDAPVAPAEAMEEAKEVVEEVKEEGEGMMDKAKKKAKKKKKKKKKKRNK